MLIAGGVKCGTVTGESVSMYGHLLLASAAGAVVLLWPTQLHSNSTAQRRSRLGPAKTTTKHFMYIIIPLPGPAAQL